MSKCNRYTDQECYFLGDFNANLLQDKQNSGLLSALKSWCNVLDMFQLNKEPTRIANMSSTLLDHIYVSDRHKIVQSGVINIPLSDHCAIFCTRTISKDKINKHNTITVRSIKNYSETEFQSKLRQTDWSSVTNNSDVETAWLEFSKIFSSVIDMVAPIKQIRLKLNTEPWMSSEILEYIKLGDNLFFSLKKVIVQKLGKTFVPIETKCNC